MSVKNTDKALRLFNFYRRHLALLTSFLICVFFFARLLEPRPSNASIGLSEEIETSLPERSVERDKLSVEEKFPHMLKRNVPLYTHLKELKVPSIDIIEMARASKTVRDLSKLSSGVRFQIFQDDEDNLTAAQFRFSALEKLIVKKINNEVGSEAKSKWQANIVKEQIDLKLVSFVGEVESSLWDSAINADMDPYLIIAMAEIFGWEVDFNREVRVKDKWRITAEKKMVKNKHVGWGSILAAEYVNAGSAHKAVLFRENSKDVGYYTLEGDNLRKMFLKSPLRFGRITSRFNKRRFHPKLKKIRPHNGVDYGVPTGTPVRSVANGVVTFAKRSGGGGKVLKIRHNSTYKTAYKHLSRYAVRKGAHVKQGQIVAYTGNTGLSTGPHLHYEFFVNGRFVDPLRQKFPSAEPIAAKHKAAFLDQSQKMVASLPTWAPKNLIVLPDKEQKKPQATQLDQDYCCLSPDSKLEVDTLDQG